MSEISQNTINKPKMKTNILKILIPVGISLASILQVQAEGLKPKTQPESKVELAQNNTDKRLNTKITFDAVCYEVFGNINQKCLNYMNKKLNSNNSYSSLLNNVKNRFNISYTAKEENINNFSDSMVYSTVKNLLNPDTSTNNIQLIYSNVIYNLYEVNYPETYDCSKDGRCIYNLDQIIQVTTQEISKFSTPNYQY
jgi:hypothetical protein